MLRLEDDLRDLWKRGDAEPFSFVDVAIEGAGNDRRLFHEYLWNLAEDSIEREHDRLFEFFALRFQMLK